MVYRFNVLLTMSSVNMLLSDEIIYEVQMHVIRLLHENSVIM